MNAPPDSAGGGRFGRWALAFMAACAAPAPVVADMQLIDRGHEGVVVEQQTGQPIAGAKVIGKWTVGYSSIAHSGQRCMKVLVVESDASGKFRLPAWERRDTDVTVLYLVVSVYKPGYRFDRSAEALVAHPTSILGFIVGGSVALPKDDGMRLQMARWDPPPAQRAQYLLDFLPSIRCTFRKDEWGTVYFVSRSVYDEFLGFPPEVQHTSRMDYIPWLKQQVDDDRRKLESEDPSWQEAK